MTVVAEVKGTIGHVDAESGGVIRRDGEAAQAVETFVLVLLGGGSGMLVLLLPHDWRPLGSSGLVWAALIANSTALLVEWRQRRRAGTADGGTPNPITGVPLLHRPWVRRTYAVVLGVLLAQFGFTADSPAVRAGLIFLGAVVAASFGPLVRRSHRRQLATARSAHPDGAVVLVALVDLATMRLAQWAKAARATLPADMGRSGVLVADSEGVALLRSGRPTRPVHRWGWVDVELSSVPHPEDHEAAALQLTLLGPLPAQRHRTVPVGRRRFDVTLSVRDGMLPARPEVVDAAVAMLESHRPTSAVLGTGSAGAQDAVPRDVSPAARAR